MKKNKPLPATKKVPGTFRITPRPEVTHPPTSSGRQMKLDVSYREGQYPRWEVLRIRAKEFGWIVNWRLRADRRTRDPKD